MTGTTLRQGMSCPLRPWSGTKNCSGYGWVSTKGQRFSLYIRTELKNLAVQRCIVHLVRNSLR